MQTMQRIEIERDAKTGKPHKKKLTLMGPPWVGIGDLVRRHGLMWVVTKASMTRGFKVRGESEELPAE